MSNNLNNKIINVVKEQFEAKCILLLLNAYEILKKKNGVNEKNENSISAQLIGLMLKNPFRMKSQISITREAYLDNEDIYAGLVDANESARIDMKYITWNSEVEYEYHMEAKNLCEKDWIRDSDNIKVKSNSLIKRYIDVGINNFISGKYPSGLLLGYIVQGNPDRIVTQINKILKNTNRSKEKLVRDKNKNFFVCYSFYPQSKNTKLTHFFLVFSNN